MKSAWILFLMLLICHMQGYGKSEGENGRGQGLVVITGVTKGLGLALAKQFAHAGWRVAGCGRSQSNILQLQKEFGKTHLFAVVDVTDDAAVGEWSKGIQEKVGTPDILINNAGVINHSAPTWEIGPEEVERVLVTNIVGTYNCIRQFVPMMIKRGRGVIINMSSSSGKEGDSTFAPYCASKFAVEGLTQCLAAELPKGLIAVSLDPGPNNTEMLRKAIGDEANSYPMPDQWAARAFPFIMKIALQDHGKALIVP